MKLSSKAQKRKKLGYKLLTQENSNSTHIYYLLHTRIYLHKFQNFVCFVIIWCGCNHSRCPIRNL